jgi:restriction system protein
MAIPDYQACMLPLLKLTSNGEIHSLKESVNQISNRFELSEEERKTLLPSGTQYIISNRVGWARSYLKKAGLIKDPKRGHFQITDEGKALLETNPEQINNKTLKQYDSFKEFYNKSNKKSEDESSEEIPSYSTPQEALEYGYQKLTESLSDDLLDTIKSCSPEFFEKVVVELLVSMGYGGSLREAAQVVGKSGDEGIDGIIKEDKLGLDIIYIQAKRWSGVVGRPEIQKFAGALMGQKARKGIFVTTSGYTKEALNYSSNLEAKIILIDGKQLASMMIENDLGVSTLDTYKIKRIDSDYFIEE